MGYAPHGFAKVAIWLFVELGIRVNRDLDTTEGAAKQQNSPLHATEAIAAGLTGIGLAAVPVWLLAQKHSLEMAVGLGMVLVPLLGLLGWASGGVGQLLKTIAHILYIFGVVTIGNATDSRLAQKILLPGNEPDLQESARQTQALLARMEAAETVEQLDEIGLQVERYVSFKKRRKVVWVVCGVTAAFLTLLCIGDLQLLRNGKQSFVLPASFKDWQTDNLLLFFPLTFVLLAVPLSVVFANYSQRYLVLSTMLSLYAGTAFYFLFHANLPALQLWVPPLVCYIVTSGIGLLAEWVSLNEEIESAVSTDEH